MTAIAGLVQDGRVWLASDAQSTWGWQKHDCGSKVFRVGEALFAWTGNSSVAHSLENRLQFPMGNSGESEGRIINVLLVDAIRNVLNSQGMTQDGRIRNGGSLIIAWRGQLYGMCCTFGIYPARSGYIAFGSGGDAAIGSLYTTDDIDMSAEERLTVAINAAAVWSVGVGGDVHIDSIEHQGQNRD